MPKLGSPLLFLLVTIASIENDEEDDEENLREEEYCEERELEVGPSADLYP